jgi:hypothetical protein
MIETSMLLATISVWDVSDQFALSFEHTALIMVRWDHMPFEAVSRC